MEGERVILARNKASDPWPSHLRALTRLWSFEVDMREHWCFIEVVSVHIFDQYSLLSDNGPYHLCRSIFGVTGTRLDKRACIKPLLFPDNPSSNFAHSFQCADSTFWENLPWTCLSKYTSGSSVSLDFTGNLSSNADWCNIVRSL